MADIAVLVMACNEPNELRRCLSSVPAAWPKYVSVDTKSTDETIEVARELATAVQTHEFTNNSWADTRNLVMEWAEGLTDINWFLWLDADEWLESGWEKLPVYIDEAEAEGAEAINISLIDYGAGADGAPRALARWTNAKVIRRGQRYERRRHEVIPAHVPRILRHDVIVGHQKTQRPEVIAACNELKHDLEAAMADFREYADQRSAWNLGSVHQRLGHYEQAVCWFTIGLSLPDRQLYLRGMLLDGRATSYRAMGLPTLAMADALQKLQLGHEYIPEAAMEIALDSYNAGQKETAEWWARAALSLPEPQEPGHICGLDKSRSVPWYVLALIEHDRGNNDEALAYMHKAILTGVDRPGYQTMRRKILEALAGELEPKESASDEAATDEHD